MKKEEFLASKLNNLNKSSFRSKFNLTSEDIDYVNNKGLDVIREHARDFINKRLSGSNILNDGKQTPMCGHPVFVAQHATATCCRGCIEKWYGIKRGNELTDKQKEFIEDLIIEWIKNKCRRNYK